MSVGGGSLEGSIFHASFTLSSRTIGRVLRLEYHDLMSLFEFLDNGEAWQRSCRSCYASEISWGFSHVFPMEFFGALFTIFAGDFPIFSHVFTVQTMGEFLTHFRTVVTRG